MQNDIFDNESYNMNSTNHGVELWCKQSQQNKMNNALISDL